MRYLQPITSLRFFFSLFVFLTHLGTLGDSFKNFVFSEGYLGVSFFFILSGFILSYTYSEKLVNGTVSTKNFIINRITRIYPLHFLTLVISLPIVFVSSESLYQIPSFFLNVSLLQSFVPHSFVYFGFNCFYSKFMFLF